MNPLHEAAVPIDAASSGASVSICYPRSGAGAGPVEAIAARGNVPLLIGDSVLAEVPRAQLEGEWQASAGLSDAQVADYCRRAASRLSRAFDSGIGAADLSELVANAAVLFVLSLREAGVSSPCEIGPCVVCHDGSGGAGFVSTAG
jgi:hypothetical protein